MPKYGHVWFNWNVGANSLLFFDDNSVIYWQSKCHFTPPSLSPLVRHYPTTKFTSVSDTPENLRLKKQTEQQSDVSLNY